MKKIIKNGVKIIAFGLLSANTHAGDYEDGLVEIGPYLNGNPNITSVGPLPTFSNSFWHNLSGKKNKFDLGYFYESPLGNIADNETQFLSFELNTNSLFSGYSGSEMHLVVSMRGNSFVDTNSNQEIELTSDVQLGGKGPILHHTDGRPDGCFGVGVEDFTVNRGAGDGNGALSIPLCESYSNLNFNLMDNSTYRIDVHASKNYVAYWMFKENLPGSGQNHWSLVATSGVYAPEQSVDASGDDSIIIGTAGRKQFNIGPIDPFLKSNIGRSPIRGAQLDISNVYVGKWSN